MINIVLTQVLRLLPAYIFAALLAAAVASNLLEFGATSFANPDLEIF